MMSFRRVAAAAGLNRSANYFWQMWTQIEATNTLIQ